MSRIEREVEIPAMSIVKIADYFSYLSKPIKLKNHHEPPLSIREINGIRYNPRFRLCEFFPSLYETIPIVKHLSIPSILAFGLYAPLPK